VKQITHIGTDPDIVCVERVDGRSKESASSPGTSRNKTSGRLGLCWTRSS